MTCEPAAQACAGCGARAEVQRAVVILNPAAGRGAAARAAPVLERLITRAMREITSPPTWEIVRTGRPGEATEIAAQAARTGADVIAAGGGDGTIREVATGIRGTGARMAVLPLGTGNDFARALGIGKSLEHAVAAMVGGRPRWVDGGYVNERLFVNVAGCGFDGAVAARVNEGYRHLRGTAAYVCAVYQTLLAYRPAHAQVTIDGIQFEQPMLLCAVSNAPTYGGGMKIAPAARIDDGKLDICLVGDVGRLEFLRVFPRVFRGTHVTHPKVRIRQAVTVRVESARAIPVLADGDVIGTTPVTFVVAPRSIEVMALPG